MTRERLFATSDVWELVGDEPLIFLLLNGEPITNGDGVPVNFITRERAVLFVDRRQPR